MTPKPTVMKKYPKAYAAKDVDGFWHIWCPGIRGTLGGGWQDARGAATAWKQAAERIANGDETYDQTDHDR